MLTGTQTPDLERHLSANPSSPLFARLAETLLKIGEISRAERLCEKGLELYPGYFTGRLIHARCLAARGSYAEALASLDDVAAHYPGNILLGELDDEWRGLAGPQAGPGQDDAAVFTDVPAGSPPAPPPPSGVISPAVVESRPVMDPGAVPEPPGVPRVPPSPEPGVVNALRPSDAPRPSGPAPVQPAADGETTTAQIALPVTIPASAEIPAPPPLPETEEALVLPPMPVPSPNAPPVPILQPVPRSRKRPGFIEAGRIVSRTLAEIYASQGAIGEAVETYRMLLERMPEMREELGPRLRQLEERLRTDQGGRQSPGNAKAPA